MPNSPAQADRSRPDTIRTVFAGISRQYDLANHLLSLGRDLGWRRTAAEQVRAWNPRDLLDLATGTGDLALAIERFCPDTTVIGADFCEPMLAIAREKGLRRTAVADGTALPFADRSFDAVTVAFGLRNMSDYPLAIREMARVTRPGGHALILDFSLPQNRLVRAVYRTYLHALLPAAAAMITRDPKAYRYLGGSIEQFPSGREMEDLLVGNGFTEPSTRPLTLGVVSLYTARRTADSIQPTVSTVT